MALETNTKVGKLRRVTDENGDSQPPASDAETNLVATGVSIDNGAKESVEPSIPGRSGRYIILADFDAAGEVRVHGLDDGGNVVVTRGPNQNDDYATAAAGQVFVDVRAFASKIRVEFLDTSGGANSVDFSVRVI